jgi:acyl-[acyl-carrier-protein] desaturase
MSKGFTAVELIHELEPVVETGVGGVYDLRRPLDDVVMPLPRKRRIFERDDLSGEGETPARRPSGHHRTEDREAVKFEESKVRYLERESRRAASEAATLSALVN